MTSERKDVKTSGMFYLMVVQDDFLYVSETWVIIVTMLKALDRAHIGFSEE